MTRRTFFIAVLSIVVSYVLLRGLALYLLISWSASDAWYIGAQMAIKVLFFASLSVATYKRLEFLSLPRIYVFLLWPPLLLDNFLYYALFVPSEGMKSTWVDTLHSVLSLAAIAVLMGVLLFLARKDRISRSN